MTPIKRRKRKKIAYRIFACKISGHHYTMSEFDANIVMITWNFTCENTISEYLPFSTFNWRHRYTSVKRTVFLQNYLLFYYHCSFRSWWLSLTVSIDRNRPRQLPGNGLSRWIIIFPSSHVEKCHGNTAVKNAGQSLACGVRAWMPVTFKSVTVSELNLFSLVTASNQYNAALFVVEILSAMYAKN